MSEATGLSGGLRTTAPRMARTITAVILLGYVANSLISVWSSGLRGWQLGAFGACLAGALALQLIHSIRDLLAWPPAARALTLTGQAVLTFVPFAFAGPQAGAIAGFLAGSVLLAMAGATRWALFAAVGAGVLVALWNAGLGPVDIGYGVYFTLLTGLVIYGISSLESLVGLMLAARGELARMAVIQERLRVARDLHDLLGYDVSAMTLKSELAYRILPMDTDQSRTELKGVLEIARRALADVRILPEGEHAMSLAAELESARSMLAAAEIDLRVDAAPLSLPVPLDTTLAIVLREALTNILRHSKAQRCVIRLTTDEGQASLCVANDHPAPEPPQPSSSKDNHRGLGNLSVRLSAIGGSLATTSDDEWFSLSARAPLDGERAAAPEDDAPVPDLQLARSWHLKVARRIAAVVLAGYGLLIVDNALPLGLGGARLAGIAACVAAMAGLQVFHVIRARRTPWLLLAQAVLTGVSLVLATAPLGSIGGFLAGSLLLILAGGMRWVPFTAIGLGVALWSAAQHSPVGWTAYLTISTLLTGLVVYGISSLANLVAQTEEARADLARMAVAKERLRVARDLHGMLGSALSAITVKAELALRLLPRFPGRAEAEIADVLDNARQAVARVRSIASGYRHMSFGAELDSAADTLAAAGIGIQLQATADAVPREADALLAVVLREAVTNILRHSDAETCTVAVNAGCGEVRLEVANDGVSSPAGSVHDDSGLGDLCARLRSVGGSLTVQVADDRFRLLAGVPLSPKFQSLTGDVERK